MHFSVAPVKTRALLRIHKHFFSPFTCIFLLHRVETALSMYTQTFFQSTPCIFLLHHVGKQKQHYCAYTDILQFST